MDLTACQPLWVMLCLNLLCYKQIAKNRCSKQYDEQVKTITKSISIVYVCTYTYITDRQLKMIRLRDKHHKNLILTHVRLIDIQ